MCVTSVTDSKKNQSVSVYGHTFSRYRPPWVHRLTPKWAWKLQGQWHKWYTTTPKSQISSRFTLRPAVFKLVDTFRHIQRLTPEWPWTPWGQSQVPHICLLVPSSPKFQSVSLYWQQFSSYRPFLRDVHRMTQKLTRTSRGQRYPICGLLLTARPKFRSVSLCD